MSLDDFARRLTALERQIEMSGSARRLSQSAIGGGGLRIYEGGSIAVEGGGSLEIIRGNLVLGEGMIDGAALSSQITTAHRSARATRFQIGGSWTDILTLTYAPPPWARQVIVVAKSAGIANDMRPDYFPQRLLSRFVITGQATPEYAGLGFIYQLMRSAARLTYAWSAIRPAQDPMTVTYQVRGDGGGTDETTDNAVEASATFISMT